jgi:type II secretory pathway predicted ATPase ExeA
VAGERLGLADAVRVDVREFRRCVAEGRLEEAAAAGQGELLQGFDGEWALRARDEHATSSPRCWRRWSPTRGGRGSLGRRRLGSPAVDVEPVGEAAHRELIRLLALAGDRAAAIAAAGVLSERLRSRFGIPPSAPTRALVEDVRRGRIARPTTPDAISGAPPVPAALAGADQPEGREAAMARLEQAWAEAMSGARRFAVIAGEPGIGKTTLAAALARRAHARGGMVLLGRSDEDALVPFQPWIEALERLLEALPAADVDHWLSAHDGALARLLPTRSAAQDASGDPRQRYLAFELVRELLDDLAACRPVVLVLDDLHWADADSLSLLRHLARSTSATRLLVVLCVRPAELGLRSRGRLATCGAKARSSTWTWRASTTTRSAPWWHGASGRQTSVPHAGIGLAAVATRSS